MNKQLVRVAIVWAFAYAILACLQSPSAAAAFGIIMSVAILLPSDTRNHQGKS
jgi:hypothetical protein